MTYIFCEGAEKSAEAQFVKAYAKERICDEYHSLYAGGIKYIPDDNCYNNREHFSFVLINQLMKPQRFSFGVEKGSLGECWIMDCVEVNDQIKQTCVKCRYRKRGCGLSEKLLDIEKDSVFSMSEQL